MKSLFLCIALLFVARAAIDYQTQGKFDSGSCAIPPVTNLNAFLKLFSLDHLNLQSSSKIVSVDVMGPLSLL